MPDQTRTALVGAIQKFSVEDGPGIRTTVFLKGCPLDCQWCHNPEMISFQQQVIEMPNSCIHCGYCIGVCPKEAIYVREDGQIDIHWDRCDNCMKCADDCYAEALRPVAKAMTVAEILREVQQDEEFYAQTGGGMTISGGEMLSQADFVAELIDAAAEAGISVCLDTSGYGNGDQLLFLASKPNVTDILYDMKSIDDEIHKEYTGHSNQVILENLIRLAEDPSCGTKLQMRMPLIHGVNDNWEIIQQTGEFYKAHHIRRVTLLPYHNLGVSKQRHIGGEQKQFQSPSDDYVEQIQSFFTSQGEMEVEILGKV